jgi:hypothetical protein
MLFEALLFWRALPFWAKLAFPAAVVGGLTLGVLQA